MVSPKSRSVKTSAEARNRSQAMKWPCRGGVSLPAVGRRGPKLDWDELYDIVLGLAARPPTQSHRWSGGAGNRVSGSGVNAPGNPAGHFSLRSDSCFLQRCKTCAVPAQDLDGQAQFSRGFIRSPTTTEGRHEPFGLARPGCPSCAASAPNNRSWMQSTRSPLTARRVRSRAPSPSQPVCRERANADPDIVTSSQDHPRPARVGIFFEVPACRIRELEW